MIKELNLELIVWRDSSSMETWTSIDDPGLKQIRPIVSVGFVLHEDDNCITLVSSYGSGDFVTGTLMIPPECIVERYDLPTPDFYFEIFESDE